MWFNIIFHSCKQLRQAAENMKIHIACWPNASLLLGLVDRASRVSIGFGICAGICFVWINVSGSDA